jgi:hypothetical protein
VPLPMPLTRSSTSGVVMVTIVGSGPEIAVSSAH